MQQTTIKAGILSMQRIANYGSTLQAYATKRLLEELGCKVQFVDYHPGKTVLKADRKGRLKRLKEKVFEAFKVGAPLLETLRYIRYKKNYAGNYFPFLGLTDEKRYYPRTDLLVVGSDEVWNCIQSNTNVGFSPELFGENNNADRVIAFAASFGNTTYEKMQANYVDYRVGKMIQKNFDAVSVRDENSKNCIERLGNMDTPEVLLDPVLNYGFKEELEEPSSDPINTPYLIVYGYTGRFTEKECKAIRKFARERSLKILNVGGLQKCCDAFIDRDPIEVIRLFSKAQYVITDTFHGSILSIITHRPFAAFVRSRGYGNSEKLKDLLIRLGLKDRMAHENNFDEVLIRTIPYDEVDKTIENYRQKAKRFLKEQVQATADIKEQKEKALTDILHVLAEKGADADDKVRRDNLV